MYTDIEKKFLLELARRSIKHYLQNNTHLEIDESDLPSEKLKEERGCFVTLHNKPSNDLRGCIGLIIAQGKLYQNVIDYAVNAATRDPRFPTVKLLELDNLHLEISVMGPIEPLPSIDHIQLGRDGLIVSKGFSQGLLLPQVPIEWEWDLTEFLEHTCMKAGLDPQAYKDPDTKLTYFSAEVFSE